MIHIIKILEILYICIHIYLHYIHTYNTKTQHSIIIDKIPLHVFIQGTMYNTYIRIYHTWYFIQGIHASFLFFFFLISFFIHLGKLMVLYIIIVQVHTYIYHKTIGRYGSLNFCVRGPDPPMICMYKICFAITYQSQATFYTGAVCSILYCTAFVRLFLPDY